MNIVTTGTDSYGKNCYFYSINTTDCVRFYHTKELIEYLLLENEVLYFCKVDNAQFDQMWHDLLAQAKEEGIEAVIEILPIQDRKKAIQQLIKRFI